MIMGSVINRHALVSLPLIVLGRQKIEIEFVLDTGFAGFLTLPAAAATRLGLTFNRRIAAHLADGNRAVVSVHEVTILWDGEEREVEVLAIGNQPLLGTA